MPLLSILLSFGFIWLHVGPTESSLLPVSNIWVLRRAFGEKSQLRAVTADGSAIDCKIQVISSTTGEGVILPHEENASQFFVMSTTCWAETVDGSFDWMERNTMTDETIPPHSNDAPREMQPLGVFVDIPFGNGWFAINYMGEYDLNGLAPISITGDDLRYLCASISPPDVTVQHNFKGWVLKDLEATASWFLASGTRHLQTACLFKLEKEGSVSSIDSSLN